MDNYNSKIMLSTNVIKDAFKYIKSDSKILIFGVGHDSKM